MMSTNHMIASGSISLSTTHLKTQNMPGLKIKNSLTGDSHSNPFLRLFHTNQLLNVLEFYVHFLTPVQL
ncbi:MAG: hypothetical protein M2R45_02660 [Verrucomicrobia subdivision 3 bacterium]|nr:hypothetical protein [Limisphaerales bacterium]MCS1414037.1 hypothetical protein [Limisphaerales bacterium]